MDHDGVLLLENPAGSLASGTGSCRNIDLLVPRRIPAVGPLGMARRPAVHHAGAPRPGARFPLAGFGCLCPWHSTHLSLGKNGRKERNNSMKWAKIALQGFSFEIFFFVESIRLTIFALEPTMNKR